RPVQAQIAMARRGLLGSASASRWDTTWRRWRGRLSPLSLRHFQEAKDAAGCGPTAEVWGKANPPAARRPYPPACMRAVTAAVLQSTPGADAARLAKEEADRAMAWLKQASSAGYRDAAHMKKDKDLDALRDREDFRKLLAELEKN